MFETAELGQKISKSEYKQIVPDLREQLLEMQEKLRKARTCQVILVFAGVDGGGKGETVSLLNEWMDPRWLKTRAYDVENDCESQRPEFWRYWRDLPPCGRIGMFLSAWYHDPLLEYVYEKIDEASFVRKLEVIGNFERTLAQNGALILKFWMHLSREAQERRLKNLERDPLTKARVTELDWEHWNMYGKFIKASEKVITRTNRGLAPWVLVEGADEYYRGVTVGTTLRDSLERHLQRFDLPNCQHPLVEDPDEKTGASKKKKKNGGKKQEEDGFQPSNAVTIFSTIDMSKELKKDDFKMQLVNYQAQLHKLHLIAKERQMSSILVFEGPDAAGKGGAIRRINKAMEARNYQVHGIAAPTEEEALQHYLWRFWRRLSLAGRVTIFDRSWYGRVLVERIEKFAREDEWRRAYAEINDFESQLIEHNTVLIKYWLHITPEEQLKRFKLRETTGYKHWKLTDEDWRNRAKWHDYEQAANDMIQYTSSSDAPWTIVEGNDKRYARVKVIKTFCERLAEALGETLDAPTSEYMQD